MDNRLAVAFICVVLFCGVYLLFFTEQSSVSRSFKNPQPVSQHAAPTVQPEPVAPTAQPAAPTAQHATKYTRQPSPQLPLGILQFTSTDKKLKELISAKCTDKSIVPPIVHYVWLAKKTIRFHEYVGMLSAHLFLKPCYILMHGDTIPSGKWWDILLTKVKNIIHVQNHAPEKIFGRRIKLIEHKADVMRLEILLEYGGIYADTDMYFLRSFDPLRNYTFTASRVDKGAVANGILVAHKDAPMLKIFYETYHGFSEDTWGGSSVQMLSKLCNTKPLQQFVHMQPGMVMLGNRYAAVGEDNLTWDRSKQYSVHLYARTFKTQNFEIEQIKKLKTTFGALSRFVLFGKTDLIIS